MATREGHQTIDALSAGTRDMLRRMDIVLDRQLAGLGAACLAGLPELDRDIIAKTVARLGGTDRPVDVSPWLGVPLDEESDK